MKGDGRGQGGQAAVEEEFGVVQGAEEAVAGVPGRRPGRWRVCGRLGPDRREHQPIRFSSYPSPRISSATSTRLNTPGPMCIVNL